MFARVFHSWERRLASVTTDRVVRPFEWGAEWLPANGNGHVVRRASLEALQEYAASAMDDTDAFYAVPECDTFELSSGELTFPSAFETPQLENNTVRARYFPARGAVRAARRAVVVLPQWNADPDGHVGLCRWLAAAGISALRLSLPYHDQRMPPELHRADYIVSANVARTLQVCRQAVMDARRAVAWLAQCGYERIGIVGTSLGSCLAMLTAAHEPRISAAALNHISPFFADVVWQGLSTAHVRAGLEGHITLEELRRCWLPISPFPFLSRMRDKRTLLVYARYDLTFPVSLSRTLIDAFRAEHVPHAVAVLPCGHYSTGVPPFKWLDGHLLVRFLQTNL